MADTASKVVITGQDTPVDSKPDAGTPAGGFNTLSVGSNGQIKGTVDADRATLATLLADKDQVISLGAGDDVFIFRNNAEGLSSRINGIVDGGIGNDRVFLGGELSDYIFSVRSDGGIKIQYAIDGPSDDGAAVTFRHFETFTFRGIDQAGVNHEDQIFTADALIAKILAAAAPPAEANAFGL